MPLLAYLSCPPVKGVTQKGNIPVIACNHHSAADGAQAFVVRKKLDASTPALHAALKDKTVFEKCDVMFWHNPPAGGQEANYLTVTLKGAQIAWISIVMPDAQLPENANIHEYEDVAFTFTEAAYSSKQPG